ncbi:MAG: hypothetical protein OXB88_04420 [Bacteriovoracales bacterium]|nr:hypothetical protein [Bacteriovoracales bacterium]
MALAFLSSCAHNRKHLAHKGKEEEVLARHLGALCLTGEGRGGLFLERRKYPFSYESLLKEDRWLLAVTLPFQGPITIEVPYGRAKTQKQGFEFRIPKKFRLRLKERQRVDRALRQISSFIEMVQGARQGRIKGGQKCRWKRPGQELICKRGRTPFHLLLTERNVILRYPSSSQATPATFGATLGEFNGRYFEKVSIDISRKKGRGGPSVVFFVKRCEKEGDEPG